MSLLAHKVKLEPVEHKYFDTDGREYISISKVLSMLHEPFDAERISYYSARKQLRHEMNPSAKGDAKAWKVQPSEAQIELRQKALQMQWKQKNKESIDIGSFIHQSIETMLQFGVLPDDKNLADATESILKEHLSGYQEFYVEEVLYSNKYLVAGTSDFIGRKVGGDNPVMEISDYKTNASKGIVFSSDYNKWLNFPVAHLEDCNYIHYALQLSFYALMMEEHGYRPGRLRLIYIPPTDPQKYFAIPIPYLKLEVEAILEYLASTGKILRNETTAWV